MKLAEWADLQDLYKQSRRRPNKLLFTWSAVRALWPMWAAAAATLPLVLFAALGMAYPVLIPFCYMLLLPWAMALYLTRMAALRTVYPAEFAEHAIDRQSALGKENILCYAFFLEAVRAAGYTAERLRGLSSYADLACKPARPGLAANLGFASMIGLIIALSAEAMKASALFALGKGWVVVMLAMAAGFLYWLILDGIHSIAYERAWIKRYLEMAACDLEAQGVNASWDASDAFAEPALLRG